MAGERRLEQERREAQEAEERRLEEEKREAQEARDRAEQERKDRQQKLLQEEEEERQRKEAERLEMLAKRAAEAKAEEQRREAEKQSKLAAERKAQVACFLKDNGFKDATTSKRKLLKTTYPLHCAAELGDPQIVGMLIEAGANPRQTNSSGKTPAQVAEKRNRNGSHNDVLRALGGA